MLHLHNHKKDADKTLVCEVYNKSCQENFTFVHDSILELLLCMEQLNFVLYFMNRIFRLSYFKYFLLILSL